VSLPSRAVLQSGESEERGRAARAVVPRSAHGEWTPASDRPDPIAILTAQARLRVPELVPIRYGRMAVSPFTFYRGAAAIMAADLAGTLNSGIVVEACGDAHISNFGGFAAPDRRMVFGPNDFDETLPGPGEWDVKRMAASVEIAAREVGLPKKSRRRLVRSCVRAYREGMQGFADESHLDVWYDRLTASELVDRLAGIWAATEGYCSPRLSRGAAKDEPSCGQEADRACARGVALSRCPSAAGATPRTCRPRRPRRRG
jgi:hypothetical protein